MIFIRIILKLWQFEHPELICILHLMIRVEGLDYLFNYACMMFVEGKEVPHMRENILLDELYAPFDIILSHKIYSYSNLLA